MLILLPNPLAEDVSYWRMDATSNPALSLISAISRRCWSAEFVGELVRSSLMPSLGVVF